MPFRHAFVMFRHSASHRVNSFHLIAPSCRSKGRRARGARCALVWICQCPLRPLHTPGSVVPTDAASTTLLAGVALNGSKFALAASAVSSSIWTMVQIFAGFRATSGLASCVPCLQTASGLVRGSTGSWCSDGTDVVRCGPLHCVLQQ